MKNKELVRLLQEQDPEEEVVIRIVFFLVTSPWGLKEVFRSVKDLGTREINGKRFTSVDFDGWFEE